MMFAESLQSAALPAVWTFLSLTGVLGVIAMASPQLFGKLARGGSRWIDTSQALAKLDTRVDVDQRVLPYCRVLGAAVIVSVVILGLVATQF